MKKKILSAALSLVMALTAFTGCAGSDSPSEGTVSSAETQSGTESAVVTSAPDEASATLLPITLPPKEEDSAADSQAEEAPAHITPLMWELTTDDGVKLTMIGAMHAVREDCYPLPEIIKKAYEEADVLAVECDVTTATENFSLQIEQLKNTYYSGGDTIENHIDKEIIEKAIEFGKEYGVDLSLYKNCKPWVWMALLEQLVINEKDFDGTLGIDVRFANMAHDEGKEIFELESADYQMKLIMNYSDKVCSTLIKDYTVENKQKLSDELESIYTAWKVGDAERFLIDAYPEKKQEAAKAQGLEISEEDMEALEEYAKETVYDRNLGMRDKIKELLAGGKKNIFLTVGTDHFVGEKGIIALLEAEGYTVKQIMPEPAESTESSGEKAA